MIPTYVLVKSTKLIYWFLHTYCSEKTVFFFISDGCEDICFTHFSCEKQISLHPSEAVPGFSDGANTSINNFFLCVSYPKYFYYYLHLISLSTQRWERAWRSLLLPFYQWPWRIPPPDRNQAKTRWVLGGSRKKMYQRIAWVSARRIKPLEQKKHDEIALKTHLLSHGSPSRCT